MGIDGQNGAFTGIETEKGFMRWLRQQYWTKEHMHCLSTRIHADRYDEWLEYCEETGLSSYALLQTLVEKALLERLFER